MKILLDTNIIVDIITQREPFFKPSYDLFALITDEKIDGIVSASSITDVYYIVRRILKDASLTLRSIMDIAKAIRIADTKSCDVRLAMISPLKDFEDAVVASVAQRECCDFIISRNTKDFISSPIPTITPNEFLKSWSANS